MKKEHCPICDSFYFGKWCPYCAINDLIAAAKDDDAKLRNAEAENAAQAERIRELEAEATEAMAGAHAEQEVSRAWKARAEAAEAELADLRADLADQRELLTISHFDGYYQGSRGLKALVINNTVLRGRVVELKEQTRVLSVLAEFFAEAEKGIDSPLVLQATAGDSRCLKCLSAGRNFFRDIRKILGEASA